MVPRSLLAAGTEGAGTPKRNRVVVRPGGPVGATTRVKALWEPACAPTARRQVFRRIEKSAMVARPNVSIGPCLRKCAIEGLALSEGSQKKVAPTKIALRKTARVRAGASF
jgi:hypothetical protein